jgi:hypothetical protein
MNFKKEKKQLRKKCKHEQTAVKFLTNTTKHHSTVVYFEIYID